MLGCRALGSAFSFFRLLTRLRRGAAACRLAVAVPVAIMIRPRGALPVVMLPSWLSAFSSLRVFALAFALFGLRLSVRGILVWALGLVTLTIMLRPVATLAIAITAAAMTLRTRTGLTFGPFKFWLWPAETPDLLKIWLGGGRCGLRRRFTRGCRLRGRGFIGLRAGRNGLARGRRFWRTALGGGWFGYGRLFFRLGIANGRRRNCLCRGLCCGLRCDAI